MQFMSKSDYHTNRDLKKDQRGVVSIHRPLGYEPSTLPLRHPAISTPLIAISLNKGLSPSEYQYSKQIRHSYHKRRIECLVMTPDRFLGYVRDLEGWI
ncbi:hypothetical protein FGO68_gene168 [Halteria grandinella]|uniref:Uncharacterized protein n=1 Tax=Halteria grandinella TaxID=5974 RepID=A0A8J8SYK7_HALGN|nr:hypothetical protein FGO68_gene168 [Halteria grandinella]